MRLLSFLLLAALGSLAASAQPFTVVSSVPADYAASVPLQTTLSFTFSERVLDYGNALDSALRLALFPAGAARLGEPQRSADGRTLTVPVTLQPETRYVALLLDVYVERGDRRLAVAALNFTTAATAGAVTVRGDVSGTGGLAPGGSVVALFASDPATGTPRIVAADVVEGAAPRLPYTLGPVPAGLYTARVFRLPSGTVAPGYGVYDPDRDGTPDPVVSATGIDLALAPPPRRTAGDGIVEAAAEAAVGASATLLGVDPAPVDVAGQASAWTYLFGGRARLTQAVRIGPLVFPVPPPGVVTLVGRPVAVPLTVDSDLALSVAEAMGGAAFRASHTGQTVEVTMRVVVLPGWVVSFAASGGDAVTFLVPFAVVDATEVGPDATPRRLALRSSNPARGAVEAMLTLDAPAEAHVVVIDALGRTVARLADGPLPAGEIPLLWTPGADTPAGTYWIVARTGIRTEALTVTRVR